MMLAAWSTPKERTRSEFALGRTRSIINQDGRAAFSDCIGYLRE